MRPFHLAFPVVDIQATIDFYCQHFGCTLGRQADRWVDLNFYGHQLSFHLNTLAIDEQWATVTIPVDGDTISVPHFGLILKKANWQQLSAQLQKQQVPFVLPPKTRFLGQPGEQGTFFIRDPSGNVLEFKYFDQDDAIFNA